MPFKTFVVVDKARKPYRKTEDLYKSDRANINRNRVQPRPAPHMPFKT
ncbi:unnamed protein product [Rhodiola kirilowii]